MAAQSAASKARDEVVALIERIKSLRAEGKSESAQECHDEAQTLLKKVLKNDRVTLSEQLSAAMSAELAQPEPGYRSVLENADEVVATGAASRVGTIGALDKAGDESRTLAVFMFDQYRKFTHNDGPDVMANSQDSRDLASDTKARAAQQLMRDDPDLDEDTARRKVDAAWTTYKHRLTDYRAEYALALDNDPGAFAEQYPLVREAFPDDTPSSAMSQYYKLDLLGYSERQRRTMKIHRLTKKLEVTGSEVERVKIQNEIDAIRESMGTAPRAARSLDVVKVTRKGLRGVSEAARALDPERIRGLPEREKTKLVRELSRDINLLQRSLSAALDLEDPEDE